MIVPARVRRTALVGAAIVAIGCAAGTHPGSSGGRAILPEGGAWQGGGQRASERTPGGMDAWTVTIPANDLRFLWRDTPDGIPDGNDAIAIDVWTDAPQNLARVSLMARSGGPRDKDDTIASTSGFVPGWNHIVFPRRRFFAHWFSKFAWSRAQVVAVRIETNGNGPAQVRVGDLRIEQASPGGAARSSAGTADNAPPVVERLTIDGGGIGGATVVLRTDETTTATLEYGATTAYGARARSDVASRRHELRPTLAPHRMWHARVRVRDTAGNESTTSDFSFSTSSAQAPPATTPFELGMFGVTTTEDLEDAVRGPFNAFQSYQWASTANNTPDDVRRYLDVAAKHDKGVIVGFDHDRTEAGDLAYVRGRVRALAGHPGVRGWYAMDEPEVHHMDPAKLAAMARAIRAEDPRHPVVIGATTQLDSDYPYRGSFDLALMDQYPVPFASPAAIIPALDDARRSGMPFGFTFQAYAIDLDHRWPASAAGPARYPSRDEMRLMAFLAIAHGAKALWAFSYDYLHFTPGSEWKWVDLGEVGREIVELSALWNSSETPGTSVKPPMFSGLDVSVRRAAGDDWIVVANTTSRVVTATLTLTPVAPKGVERVDAYAAIERQPLSYRDGRLNARWEPYGVQVFRVRR